MSKKKTPYDYLMDDFVEYVNKVRNAENHEMWLYSKKDLDRAVGWDLRALWERVSSAEVCGFETILKATEAGIHVYFRKQSPPRPWRVY